MCFKCNIYKTFVNKFASATSDQDQAPKDSFLLEPISGNNPFEEDIPSSG